MPDAPEIPAAKDPFEKRVALTIAIIAICNSFVVNHGDNAKTAAILKTSEALDQWGYFQAKSTKAQLSAMHGDLLIRLSTGERSEESRNNAIKLGQEARRYDLEKAEIKTKAETWPPAPPIFPRSTIAAIRRRSFFRSPWLSVRFRSWPSRTSSGGLGCLWEPPASWSAPLPIFSEALSYCEPRS
jgi:hypothetical protein